MEGKGSIAQDKLELIIRRIVEVAKPEKIILFGSAARGAMFRGTLHYRYYFSAGLWSGPGRALPLE